MYIQIGIIFIALIGSILSVFLFLKKKQAEKLYCPLRADCHTVLRSKYSTFFGIPLELLGAGYYTLIALFYSVLLFSATLITPVLSFVVLLLTIIGFLFSIYLVAIQGFVLKAWCSWCLTSAVLSTTLMILTSIHIPFDAIALMGEYRRILLILHVFAVTLGMGGAVFSDIFFFKFLKDYRISSFEDDTLNTLSQVIWFALGVLVLTGIGIYLPNAEVYNATPKFLAKMSIIGIIILNGFVLNLLIAPNLIKITFDNPTLPTKALHRLRRLAFALGGVSLTSWLFSFVYAMLKGLPQSYEVLMSIYFGVLICAVIGSQVAEYVITRKKIQL